MTVLAMLRANPSPKTLAPVDEREIIEYAKAPWLDVARHRRAGCRDARINLAIQCSRRDFAESIGVE